MRRLPLAALVLPLVEATAHGDDVGVPEVLQRLGGEGGADATGAEHDHRGVAVGDAALDLRLEVTPRDEHGAGDGTLLELVRLPDVEEHGVGLGTAARVSVGRGDLPDLGLGLGEEIAERRHRAAFGVEPGPRAAAESCER